MLRAFSVSDGTCTANILHGALFTDGVPCKRERERESSPEAETNRCGRGQEFTSSLGQPHWHTLRPHELITQLT